jgi:hypothetical protein
LLPGLECKVALVQHAGMLQNHQLLEEMKGMCMALCDSVTTIRKSLSDTVKFSIEQKVSFHAFFHDVLPTLFQAEITATCKVVFFSGRLTDFDNEVLKPEVIVSVCISA